MRIVKRGILPEEVLYTTTCQYCKSVIEFARIEAKQSSDQRDGTYLIINCPVCNSQVYHNV